VTAQQSVTKIISLTIMNLVTLKAQAKHEHLFNKQADKAGRLASQAGWQARQAGKPGRLTGQAG
jgi:hypothetical protein